MSKQKVSRTRKWEVLLIDNGSTDKTNIIAKESVKGTRLEKIFRVVKENKPGISNARNRALKSSQYGVISFVDDDNYVSPKWVESVADIFEEHKEVAVVGGKNKSLKIEDTPVWFEKYKHCYAIGEQSDVSGDISISRGFVWGAGMSVRKQAWVDIKNNGFMFFLTGRVGKVRSAGEDSELSFALRLFGWKIWYDKRLSLVHDIDQTRLSWSELRIMFRGFGAGRVGHNPYFFAEVEPKFVHRWYIQVLPILWNIAKDIPLLLKMQFQQLEGEDEILKMEHKIGQLQFMLSKGFEFDKYTSRLRKSVN